MAYNKRNWKARQGTGLNFFSIDGATPVPIVNQPTTLTEAGDALSAGNLNDWEQRIADAFDDVEESKADKSTTDALQSQINQHESRLENLEQKAGDYSIVQYRGTNAVPTGKAKYGLVKNIVGKSRAWNQLYDPTGYEGGTVNDVVITKNADASWNFNGTASALIEKSVGLVHIINGHKYLIMCSKADAGFRFYVYGNNIIAGGTNYGGTGNILTATGSGNANLLIYISNGSQVNNLTEYFLFRDLTLISGPGNEPSTVADALAQLPALGQYNAYDAGSLVDTEVSGVKSVGRNLWDEVYEEGDIQYSTGIPLDNPNYIRSVNFCKVTANTSIYVKANNTIWLLWYDANYNYLGGTASDGSVGGTVATSPANARYFKLVNRKDVFDGKICINVSDSQNGTYTPYMTDTLSLSTPVTLRSAGSVGEVLDVQTGKKSRPVGTVIYDGSDDEGWGEYNATYDGFSIYPQGILCNADNPSTQILANVFVVNKQRGASSNVGSGPVLKTWTSTSDNFSFFLSGTGETTLAGFKAWLANHVTTINYNLATPLSDEQVCDPITDNFIEVEGGGTVETIQTQTPVIDNCLDVGYLTV